MEVTDSATSEPAANHHGKRPAFLTVLCILSLLGGGISIIIATLRFWFLSRFGLPGGGAGLFFALDILLILAGLAGVLLMWKMKIAGLYVYALASLTGSILPLIQRMVMPAVDTSGSVQFSAPLMGSLNIPFVGLALSVLLIALYLAAFRALPVEKRTIVPAFVFALILVIAAISVIIVSNLHMAQINGQVSLHGTLDQPVRIGYEVLTSDNQFHSQWEEHQPQGKSQLPVHYTKLPSGKYFLYAKYGDTYADWQVVNVDWWSKNQVNLTIDLSQTGTLDVEISRGKGAYQCWLQPLTALKDAIPAVGGDFLRVPIQGESATIKDIRAGNYSLGVLGKEDDSSYRGLGDWKIEIAAGKTLNFQVPGQATAAQ